MIQARVRSKLFLIALAAVITMHPTTKMTMGSFWGSHNDPNNWDWSCEDKKGGNGGSGGNGK